MISICKYICMYTNIYIKFYSFEKISHLGIELSYEQHEVNIVLIR